jgi:carbamate kinase
VLRTRTKFCESEDVLRQIVSGGCARRRHDLVAIGVEVSHGAVVCECVGGGGVAVVAQIIENQGALSINSVSVPCTFRYGRTDEMTWRWI